jgi:lipopolysaccharide transport system permease protein
MASVTAPPQSAAPLPAVVRIEPQRGWLELRLAEVWEYRELLYFLSCATSRSLQADGYRRDLQVLQPLMTMGVFTIFSGAWRSCLRRGCHPVFYFAALVRLSQALTGCTNIVGITKCHHQSVFSAADLPVAASFRFGDSPSAWWSFVLTLSFGIQRRDGAAAPGADFLAMLTALGVACDLGAERPVPRCAVIPFVVQF